MKDTPNCWICKDGGMVFYFKIVGGISYDFAYRCNCILGQASSHSIRNVPRDLAENIAVKNYRRFSEDFND